MVHVQKNTQHSIKLGDGIWVVASFPGVTSGKESTANAGNIRDMGSVSGSGRSPEKRAWQFTSVVLPGESHRQKSLAGYSS